MTFRIKLQMLIEKLASRTQIQFQMHLKSNAIAMNTVCDCMRSSLCSLSNFVSNFSKSKFFLSQHKFANGLWCIFKIHWLENAIEWLLIAKRVFAVMAFEFEWRLLFDLCQNKARDQTLNIWMQHAHHATTSCRAEVVCKQFRFLRKKNSCLHLTFNALLLFTLLKSLVYRHCWWECLHLRFVYTTNNEFDIFHCINYGSPLFSV